jgi:hypothetical protein
MTESVACPDCHVRLELPALPKGQTVQCPRCARVFEPALLRAAPKSVTQAIVLLDDAPIEPAPLTPTEPLGGAWKAPAAMIALIVFLLSCLLQIYVHYEQYELIQQDLAAPLVLGRRHVIDLDRHIRWHAWEAQRDVANVILFVTFWPAAILFLIWLHQASRNAWSLQAEGLQFGPATTLSFFIPILNLVLPYCMVQEIWRASHPRAVLDPLGWKEGPSSVTIRLWWASYVAAILVGSLLCAQSDMAPREDAALFVCLGGACVVAGLALMIYIIHGIRVRQNERYARLNEEAE